MGTLGLGFSNDAAGWLVCAKIETRRQRGAGGEREFVGGYAAFRFNLPKKFHSAHGRRRGSLRNLELVGGEGNRNRPRCREAFGVCNTDIDGAIFRSAWRSAENACAGVEAESARKAFRCGPFQWRLPSGCGESDRERFLNLGGNQRRIGADFEAIGGNLQSEGLFRRVPERGVGILSQYAEGKRSRGSWSARYFAICQSQAGREGRIFFDGKRNRCHSALSLKFICIRDAGFSARQCLGAGSNELGTCRIWLNRPASCGPESDKIIAKFRAAEICVIHGTIRCRSIPSAATDSPKGAVGFITRPLSDIATHVVETEFVWFLLRDWPCAASIRHIQLCAC